MKLSRFAAGMACGVLLAGSASAQLGGHVQPDDPTLVNADTIVQLVSNQAESQRVFDEISGRVFESIVAGELGSLPLSPNSAPSSATSMGCMGTDCLFGLWASYGYDGLGVEVAGEDIEGSYQSLQLGADVILGSRLLMGVSAGGTKVALDGHYSDASIQLDRLTPADALPLVTVDMYLAGAAERASEGWFVSPYLGYILPEGVVGWMPGVDMGYLDASYAYGQRDEENLRWAENAFVYALINLAPGAAVPTDTAGIAALVNPGPDQIFGELYEFNRFEEFTLSSHTINANFNILGRMGDSLRWNGFVGFQYNDFAYDDYSSEERFVFLGDLTDPVGELLSPGSSGLAGLPPEPFTLDTTEHGPSDDSFTSIRGGARIYWVASSFLTPFARGSVQYFTDDLTAPTSSLVYAWGPTNVDGDLATEDPMNLANELVDFTKTFATLEGGALITIPNTGLGVRTSGFYEIASKDLDRWGGTLALQFRF